MGLEVGGEPGHIGLGEHDGARRAQPLDRDGVALWPIIGELPSPAGRRQAGGLETVLDGDRQAFQCPRLAARITPVRLLRLPRGRVLVI